MKLPVGDTDSIRRQNRALVLEVLRRHGPMSRGGLARDTGLSNATITAISTDMIAQNVLCDMHPEPETGVSKGRGRPSVRVGFCRRAGYAMLFELTVNMCRCSLVDYAGTLLDRVQEPVTPKSFEVESGSDFIARIYHHVVARNPEVDGRMMRAAISVQGILDPRARRLTWSPISHITDVALVDTLEDVLNVRVALFKRGQLLAQGTKLLYPDLQNAEVATIFVGSTVGMGISEPGNGFALGTEFGHMNHVPDGALCRCGMRGCIEAYASDYGVLRSTFGVPDKTPPARSVPAAEYMALIDRARRGNREANRAFQLAGRAMGYGIGRLMTVFDPQYVIVAGPGAEAFDLMQADMNAAVAGSIMSRVRKLPEIRPHRDESEPVYRGLADKTLSDIDLIDFAPLPASGRR